MFSGLNKGLNVQVCEQTRAVAMRTKQSKVPVEGISRRAHGVSNSSRKSRTTSWPTDALCFDYRSSVINANFRSCYAGPPQ